MKYLAKAFFIPKDRPYYEWRRPVMYFETERQARSWAESMAHADRVTIQKRLANGSWSFISDTKE